MLDFGAVDVATIVTAFATVFLAELPDKTMLATIMLSARFRRPPAVWVGAAGALTVQATVAVVAGQVLSLLPTRPVRFGVAGMFFVGAVLLWRSSTKDDDGLGELEGDAGDAFPDRPMSSRRVSATVFGVVFLAEWGDLTQLATASLASTRPGLSVLIGAALAFMSVALIGVLAGSALLRLIPERILHRVAAIVFALLSIAFFIGAIRTVDVGTDIRTR